MSLEWGVLSGGACGEKGSAAKQGRRKATKIRRYNMAAFLKMLQIKAMRKC
jgi:hypothetical protein